MGRSQVLRNRARGRGRGGREGGTGGRGGSSTNTSRHHKGGMDTSKLGDNAFRYERNNNNNASDDNGGGGRYDGLLDDINFMSSGVGGVGEYYGDSHYAPNDGEEDLVDAILLSSATAALSLSSEKNNEKRDNMNNQQQNKDKAVENWMTIDIKALDKCMKQIPIHERLKLPYHIGVHLEDMYGDGASSSSGRTKTLAQLREESKCIVSKEEEGSKIEPSNEELQSSETNDLQNDSEKVEDKISNCDDADNNANDDDEEEEDLDAWLDDMIA